MKLFTVLALALSVSAVPVTKRWSGCLCDEEANYLVSQSIVYLEHKDLVAARAAAYSIFSDNIAEFGDSINALRGDPLGTQVEDGITRYVNDTLSTPPIDQINTLHIVHDCKQVAWNWEFIGIGPQRIRGFTLMEVGDDMKIYEQFVEFNSLTWGIDIGFNVSRPAYFG